MKSSIIPHLVRAVYFYFFFRCCPVHQFSLESRIARGGLVTDFYNKLTSLVAILFAYTNLANHYWETHLNTAAFPPQGIGRKKIHRP